MIHQFIGCYPRLKKTALTAVFCVLAALTCLAQAPNRPKPPAMPPYAFVIHDSTYQGYYLTTPFRLNGNAFGPKPAAILDAKGFVLWFSPVFARNVNNFMYNPEAQMYQFVRFQNPQTAHYLLLDTAFNLVDSFTTVNGILPDSHEFHLTDDNTYLLAGVSDSIMDLSAFIINGAPGSPTTRAVGFVVQEFDSDHNLLYEWDSNDHIHPAQAYASFYGYNPNNFDYCHGNSIDEDTDGHLLLSFRHLNAVYKIDRQTGAVIWQLGGKSSSFSFVNDAGFSGQHDARRLPNGNIAIFDNANMADTPRVSRAVEYALDTVNWVATKVWEYQYTPNVFSPAMGSHQTTPERLHLIEHGFVFRPDPNSVLVDDAGRLIAELIFADSVMSYRTYYYSDLPVKSLQRPVITCSQNNGVVTLSAPPGYNRYVWSTGEMAPSITLNDTGVYQVWVNYGAGMLGSEPFFVDDLSAVCPLTGAGEPAGPGGQKIVGYYDLLGRAIANPEAYKHSGTLLLVRFADGSVRLRGHF